MWVRMHPIQQLELGSLDMYNSPLFEKVSHDDDDDDDDDDDMPVEHRLKLVSPPPNQTPLQLKPELETA